MINKQLYIGISGLAGSGKDTVGHMLVYILNDIDKPYADIKRKFFNAYSEESQNITRRPRNNKVHSVAFADTLKNICASLFGISVDYFYNYKDDGYVNISGTFEYTNDLSGIEEAKITTAREYNIIVRSDDRYNPNYWMSFRELLVYVGTFLSQERINYNTYVNNVRNTLKNNLDDGTQYVLFTDVRFDHELDFVRRQNCGITIYVQRALNEDEIKPSKLNEGELKAADVIINNDYSDYDYVIENFGTMEDLFKQVYDLVTEEPIFRNNIIEISNNILLREYKDETKYKFVFDRTELYAPISDMRYNDQASYFFVNDDKIAVGEFITMPNGTSRKVENLYCDMDNNYIVELQ